MNRRVVLPMSTAGVVLAVIAVVALGGNSSPQEPMTGESGFDIPEQDPVLVAEGDGLHQARCAACHGPDFRGTAVGPSQLSVVYQPGHHPDESHMSTAFSGVKAHHRHFGDMAPVVGVTENDMVRIIALIRKTQRIEDFEPYLPQ